MRATSTRRSRPRQGDASAASEPSAHGGRVEGATAAGRERRRPRGRDRRAEGDAASRCSSTLAHGARRASRRTRQLARTLLETPQSDGATARRRSTGARARRWPSPRCSPRATHVRLTGQDTRARHLQPPPRGAARREDRRDATCRSQHLGRGAGAASRSTTARCPRLGCWASSTATASTTPTRWSSGRRSSATSPTARRSSSTSSSSPAEDKWHRLSRARAAAAPRLRGRRARSTRARGSSASSAVRRGQHPGLQPDHAGADLPPAAPAGAAPVAQAAGRDDARRACCGAPEASSPLERAHHGRVPAGHRRSAGERRRQGDRACSCAPARSTTTCSQRARRRERRHRRHRRGSSSSTRSPRASWPALLASYPGLHELVWVQEEPQNMGAWRFILPRLHELASARGRSVRCRLRRAARRARARPPDSTKTHELEQKLIVDAALSRGQHEWPLSSPFLQLGESITEAVVGKWHKKVGDAVAVDEPVVVLETDKVTVDVPAPAAGALEPPSPQGGRQGEGRRRAREHRTRRRRGAAGGEAAPARRARRAGACRAPAAPAAQPAAEPRASSDAPGTASPTDNGVDPATLQGSGARRPGDEGRRARPPRSAAAAPRPAAPVRPPRSLRLRRPAPDAGPARSG